MSLSQPIPVLPDLANDNLVLASLNKATRGTVKDYSTKGNDGAITSAPEPQEDGGYSHDGVDDKIDYGDIGNIQAIEMWVNPNSTTEELILVDAGNDIMVNSGTITYTGLTASATYVNGEAGTTLAAGEESHLICVFTQVDANNFETANDGANYGNVVIKMLNVYNEIPTAAWAKYRFQQSVPDDSLVLQVDDGTEDRSRFKNTLTPSGGIILGDRPSLDGTDDALDCGDIGNIQTVLFWVNPTSTTEELFLVDAGNDVMVSAGTITYTGLTAAATYVNGTASTTLAAGRWQRVMCVFTQIDADNFEIGTDGANFGQFKCDDFRCYDAVKSADYAKLDYNNRGVRYR